MEHRVVEVPGGHIHLASEGEGPLVLMVHGFPETWYSWRHQLPAVAAAGFRAVAMDVRGYGRSSAPPAVEAYRMLALVGDVVGVVRSLGEERAILVGHDWGSPIAATTALLRPELVSAVALLSVPYTPPSGPRPTELYAALGGEDEEFYISYFQAPGRAEAEIEPDVRGWLARIYVALSGDAIEPPDGGSVFFVARGARLGERFVLPDSLPAWLTEADLDAYAADFERTGMTGALNRYRNVDRDWEDLAAWRGLPLGQPALFIGGDRDGPTNWMAKARERQRVTLPGLVASHVLPGCGHWLQQERPQEVNRLLVEWLRGL
jgi:pimeloyl-ACP methyl ester carboxylesterase